MNLQDNFYRLVKPYDSNLLHPASSLTGGASRCYKELKKVCPNVEKFSIIHMPTSQLYEFEVNKLIGGNIDTTVQQSEIKKLESEIDSLKKRLIVLEDKINHDLSNNLQHIKPHNTPTVSHTQQHGVSPTQQHVSPTQHISHTQHVSHKTTGGFDIDFAKKLLI